MSVKSIYLKITKELLGEDGKGPRITKLLLGEEGWDLMIIKHSLGEEGKGFESSFNMI
jgi:hypothetical protein